MNNTQEKNINAQTPEENTSTEAVKESENREMAVRIVKLAAAILLSLVSLVAGTGGFFVFNSGTAMSKSEEVSEVRTFAEDIKADIHNRKSDIVNEIYSIPKVYILPWSEAPAPVPDPDGYTYAEGNKYPVSYEDETIRVDYWTEKIYGSVAHFAKVKIAHPTQLRTAFAGGKYGSETRYNPRVIAQNVNAVIATNADYYNYRKGGVIVRQNVLYRNKPFGWDVLMIDNMGNFHILYDKDEKVQELLESGNIVNTLHFGPSLIIDGKIKIMHDFSGCGEDWNYIPSPRTAIGQIGELTYLMCCVEGRMKDSEGIGADQMAQIMLDKGCVQAYLLDGGQSTTMVWNGESVNRPLWGGMRSVSDVVYFATAIDE